MSLKFRKYLITLGNTSSIWNETLAEVREIPATCRNSMHFAEFFEIETLEIPVRENLTSEQN